MKWAQSSYEELIRHWEVAHRVAIDDFDDDCLFVKYEDLCERTGEVLGSVAQHCGLAARPDALSIERRFDAIKNSNDRYLADFPTLDHDVALWSRLGYEVN